MRVVFRLELRRRLAVEKDGSFFLKNNEKTGLVIGYLGQTTALWRKGEAQ
jgi:hypothetical protein